MNCVLLFIILVGFDTVERVLLCYLLYLCFVRM